MRQSLYYLYILYVYGNSYDLQSFKYENFLILCFLISIVIFTI